MDSCDRCKRLEDVLRLIANACAGHNHQWCDHANDAPGDSCQVEQIALAALAPHQAQDENREKPFICLCGPAFGHKEISECCRAMQNAYKPAQDETKEKA